ncbi:lymphocyte-specific protein 1-like [Nelusetta ayraudi]|uniref:lymphocyte-specific protein 1-like n=1 Tax=Nelusetta ayraudi TaxID=303726 RepID=UPI003F7157D5
MSESIKRKNSSKQVLQNLIRVTAQRSQEDAEEVERERRRRSREKERGDRSPSCSEGPLQDELAYNTEPGEHVKPSCCLGLDEDEGFSDWTHRLENRVQVKEGREEDGEEEGRSLEASPSEKTSATREEMRPSHASTVFLPRDARTQDYGSSPADKMSHQEMVSRGGACWLDGQEEQQQEEEEEEEHQIVEEHASLRQEGEPSFMHEEMTQLHLSGTQEETDEYQIERRPAGGSSPEAGRSRNSSSSAGDEPLGGYGPMSPTFKKLLIQFYPGEASSRASAEGKCLIVERTVSLRKSTNSVKKAAPPVAVSKIDQKLEQYTQALEVSSKESKSGSQVAPELTGVSEPVASKRNLFEAGEAWNQSGASVAALKDTDGLKVGVAKLINQWVTGSEDGSRCSSPFKPADNSSNKRSKFVVTGHGKYEKVLDDNDGCDDTNCPPAPQLYEDL